MPKRKKDKCDEREFEYLAKKLKRLERKFKSGRRRHSSSSSDSDHLLPRNQKERNTIAAVDEDVPVPEPGCSYWDDWPVPINLSDEDSCPDEHDVAPVACPAQAPAGPAPTPNDTAPSPAPAPAAPGPQPAAPAQGHVVAAQPAAALAPLPAVGESTSSASAEPGLSTVSTPTVSTIDPSLLAILGEDPTSIKEYGDEVQNDLAIRLNHIATSGLSKDGRKELTDRHLIPSNCKMIKAPTLNAEIRASLIESQAKRDKGIENKQTLNACALSALSKAITLLLSSDNVNQELLKLLMDSARTLADIQHSDSILRRFFILSTVKKDLKDQLEKTKIDNMLFGANLAETLKSARTINRSGTEIRSTLTPRTSAPRPVRMANRPLNARAPPAGRRPAPAGGARYPRPAPPATLPPRSTTTAQRGSRTSSRQPLPRYRR